MGSCVADFARTHNVSRSAVNDALRGLGKGDFGQSRTAAVALGMKRACNSGTQPLESHQPTEARSNSGNIKPTALKSVRKAGEK